MKVEQTHPMDIVEMPPTSLPPLSDAMTEEQHVALMTEAEKKAEEEAKAVAEAERAAAEEARQAALKEAYVAAIPDEISERVAAAVAREMQRLKVDMEAQFSQQHERLLTQVTELQAKVAV
jgi:flagellar biosynthesis/type III secretory pathway protein FliH